MRRGAGVDPGSTSRERGDARRFSAMLQRFGNRSFGEPCAGVDHCVRVRALQREKLPNHVLAAVRHIRREVATG